MPERPTTPSVIAGSVNTYPVIRASLSPRPKYSWMAATTDAKASAYKNLVRYFGSMPGSLTSESNRCASTCGGGLHIQ